MRRLALALALVFAGCTAEADARAALHNYGFTHVELTGWSPAACHGDFSATGFSARNASGAIVEGVVCCGVVKGCTVRW